MALDPSGDLVLLGGSDGQSGVFSISRENIVQTLTSGGPAIIDCLWVKNRAVIGTSNGSVKLFENGSEVCSFLQHAGQTTSLALHPSGKILASVGVDKSYVFYDIDASTVASQVFTNSGMSLTAGISARLT